MKRCHRKGKRILDQNWTLIKFSFKDELEVMDLTKKMGDNIMVSQKVYGCYHRLIEYKTSFNRVVSFQ